MISTDDVISVIKKMGEKALDSIGAVGLLNVLAMNLVFYGRFEGEWHIYDKFVPNEYGLPWATAYIQHMVIFVPLSLLYVLIKTTPLNLAKPFFYAAEVAQVGPTISYWVTLFYFVVFVSYQGGLKDALFEVLPYGVLVVVSSIT